MNKVEDLFQRFTWLSLDVVFGAMGGLLFFSRLLRVPILWQVYGLLGLAVWVIYTLDHLLDARGLIPGATLDRHSFHQKHSKTLWTILVFALALGLIGSVTVFGFEKELVGGIGLGLVILLLMALIRILPISFHWIKEINTAIFYVAGVSLLPFIRFSFSDWTWEIGFILAGYIGLAYLNLVMLSYLDADKDKASGFGSLVSVWSKKKISLIIRILSSGIILVFLLGFIFLSSFYRVFSCLILLMGLIHFVTFYDKSLSSNQIRLRMEATFFLPWLLLFW
ncbi:hypothetical protein JYB64_16560 [Algoriphagus aestuarii]|nr:hypothetical protein [Algoriphagus aestuarii]